MKKLTLEEQAELLRLLEKAQDAAELEAVRDRIGDVMDFLTGWCSPYARIQIDAREQREHVDRWIR